MSKTLFETTAIKDALTSNVKADALAPKVEALAPISAYEIYPLSIFKVRTGLGSKAMRVARRGGLVVKRIGTRSYVKGADFFNWYDTQPTIAG